MSSTLARKKPIYLDYSATTPVDPRVAEKMIPWLTEWVVVRGIGEAELGERIVTSFPLGRTLGDRMRD